MMLFFWLPASSWLDPPAWAKFGDDLTRDYYAPIEDEI